MTASAHPSAQRFEFAPPPTAGLVRSFGLAVMAHAVLVAALTWGVQWKRDAITLSAEAELWASVPEAAAPKLIEPQAAPEPAPVVVAPPPAQPAPAPVPNPSIAIEQEKKRQLDAKRVQDERAVLDKKRIDQQRAADKALKLEKAQALEKEKDKKTAEDKKKADQKLALTKQAALADAKKTEEQRQENIKRITGLAGATGSANATGAALQSAGPSPGYTGRIIGRIRPNIVFTEDVAGNPQAVVEVRVGPNGAILSRKIIKSSGNTAWDEAVLKAIDKTEILPLDVDGRVPPSMEISFRPKN